MRPYALLFILSLLTASAQLQFDSTNQKISPNPKAQFVEVAFPFSALSDTEIERIEVHCSCIKPLSKPKTFASGERDSIKLKLETKSIKGTVQKSVTIHTKDHKSQKLIVTATIPKVINITPKSLIWYQNEEATTKSYTITIDPGYDLEITKVLASRPLFHQQLIETSSDAKKGKSYQLQITPKSLDYKGYCMLKVQTNSKIPRYQSSSLISAIKPPKN